MKNKGFTLAEIMIALTVIGVITSIILPVALQTVPDENVMKFKKGNAILAKAINEMVSSGKYFKDGDLGTRADGTLIDGENEGDKTYFCSVFADMLNTKSVECKDGDGYSVGVVLTKDNSSAWTSCVPSEVVTSEFIDFAIENLDNGCIKHKDVLKEKASKIVLIDGIEFYEEAPAWSFGAYYDKVLKLRGFGTGKENSYCYDSNGFDRSYKLFCMDVDGIDSGEEPFGYGIRADGKILLGKRAQEWLNKSIQEK